MKIISLNANGIRAAARKGLYDWLKQKNADVVCIQETKAQEHQLTGNCFKFVADAFKEARSVAKENDLIFIGGSTFVVAEII